MPPVPNAATGLDNAAVRTLADLLALAPTMAHTEQVLLAKGSVGTAPFAVETEKQNNTGFVTLADVESLIKKKAMSFSPTVPMLDTRPPYPLKLARLPYPEGYRSVHFARYDGKRGNSKEHVARFLDSLGIYREDETLCL